jgi:hypothetical protein
MSQAALATSDNLDHQAGDGPAAPSHRPDFIGELRRFPVLATAFEYDVARAALSQRDGPLLPTPRGDEGPKKTRAVRMIRQHTGYFVVKPNRILWSHASVRHAAPVALVSGHGCFKIVKCGFRGVPSRIAVWSRVACRVANETNPGYDVGTLTDRVGTVLRRGSVCHLRRRCRAHGGVGCGRASMWWPAGSCSLRCPTAGRARVGTIRSLRCSRWPPRRLWRG